MQCAICDAKTNRCVQVNCSRSGPDGLQTVSGKVYACGQHIAMIGEMSTQELELFMRPNARPASSPPVKQRDETSGEAETRFEPQRTQSNGNGLT